MIKDKTPRIIARPTKQDLSSSIDTWGEIGEEMRYLAPRVPSEKEASIGIHFIETYLLDRLSKRQFNIATKPQRLKKWEAMITYGLESDIAPLVFSKQFAVHQAQRTKGGIEELFFT